MTKAATFNETPRSKNRRWLARLLLLCAGLLLGLVAAELCLRILNVTYFNPYIVDQDLGYTLRPGEAGWWQKESKTYVRINSHGFRDREHSITKPANTLRIAVLGDSYAEAFQVPLEKTFWSLMEQRLQSCSKTAGTKIEVLNFGMSGLSTGRELILLRNRVWQYSPDVVVLLVTTGNDVRDNSRTLNAYTHQPIPYFFLQDGKLGFDDSLLAARNQTLAFRFQRSFLGNWFHWLQRNSRVLGLIYTVREGWQSRRAVSENTKDNRVQIELGLDSEVYRQPVSREWDDAWLLTERLIVTMRDEVNARGSKFLVVTGSIGVQVTPDRAVREQFMSKLGVQNLSYPDDRLRHLGEREGFKVLNLVPTLQEYAERNQVFLHGRGERQGKGHWNETGHQLAGELIADELCKNTL